MQPRIFLPRQGRDVRFERKRYLAVIALISLGDVAICSSTNLAKEKGAQSVLFGVWECEAGRGKNGFEVLLGGAFLDHVLLVFMCNLAHVFQ